MLNKKRSYKSFEKLNFKADLEISEILFTMIFTFIWMK